MHTTNCSGNWYDLSDSFYNNWSTGSTSIATVNYYGTHTGVSVGSTASNTFGTIQQTQDNRLECPAEQFRPGGGVNVMKLSCPSSVARAGSITCSVSSAPTGATFSGWKFTDSNNNTVTSGNTAGSWSGT